MTRKQDGVGVANSTEHAVQDAAWAVPAADPFAEERPSRTARFKDAAHRGTPPAGPRASQERDRSLNRLFAAAREGRLPRAFRSWGTAADNGWTLAHEAARFGTLPEGFSWWNLPDDDGITVAQVHSMAAAARAKSTRVRQVPPADHAVPAKTPDGFPEGFSWCTPPDTNGFPVAVVRAWAAAARAQYPRFLQELSAVRASPIKTPDTFPEGFSFWELARDDGSTFSFIGEPAE
ncbi:MAG: hypothetical protein LBT40_05250 [Deltaproteobacteria bacterium]|jgi:hypothetical protein|nr:hypothetical protein [Deltaproteobacteria bacterium]